MNHLTIHKHPESSYLRAYKAPLHLSRTLYKSALFMQNKPNFLNAQMNVKSIHAGDYENIANWKLGENKANTKPIKANLPDDQMNVSGTITKDYENERLRRRGENKPNQTQFQRQKNAQARLFRSILSNLKKNL